MPLRDAPHGIGSALRLGRRRRCLPAPTLSLPRPASLHTSRILRARDDGASDDDNSHYDTLNIHPDASAAEIKKSFYTLSKTHHPDHNPTDPHASRRFMRISEAYATLSHAEKRARYDRDVLRLRRHHNHPPHAHHGGSYHSTNPAGGRPPSGLSRRRGTFTGPPPSFFRSGGWGAHATKRREAHDESTGGAGTHASSNNNNTTAGGPPPPPGAGARHHGQAGGMGPGQSPFGGRGDDVPHFDRASHERSHRERDARRAQRMAERNPFIPETGMWGGFALIMGVLTVAILGPYVVIDGWMRVSRTATARETAKGRENAAGSGIRGAKG
ncbi:DnaJ domain-containing protein [Podospora appendiculata]|uniref:DnaJ domain-containing protein n=1 Tax=Podospora appendiculata TaxID=314037 RepID=A0AAE0X5P4_9PEZI|nr:DnaJ domain-containing protein [Podospora appendiculata]